jgi:hypothetical protein
MITKKSILKIYEIFILSLLSLSIFYLHNEINDNGFIIWKFMYNFIDCKIITIRINEYFNVREVFFAKIWTELFKC